MTFGKPLAKHFTQYCRVLGEFTSTVQYDNIIDLPDTNTGVGTGTDVPPRTAVTCTRAAVITRV